MTLVKICGIRDPEGVRAAAEAGADFVGIMFAESKRRVSPEAAMAIGEAVRELRRNETAPRITGPEPGEVSGRTWFAAWSEAIEDALARARPLLVGVFADQDVAQVNRIAATMGLDLVQWSGTGGFAAAREIDRPAVAAVHVGPEDDAEDVAERIEPGHAVGILLDTKVGEQRGGTGETFDWSIAADVAARQPVMLAGGLTPENVGDAVAAVSPWAVDVSTGVERDGTKDHELVRSFVRAAKGRNG